jgi:hypothetical protein
MLTTNATSDIKASLYIPKLNTSKFRIDADTNLKRGSVGVYCYLETLSITANYYKVINGGIHSQNTLE